MLSKAINTQNFINLKTTTVAAIPQLLHSYRRHVYTYMYVINWTISLTFSLHKDKCYNRNIMSLMTLLFILSIILLQSTFFSELKSTKNLHRQLQVTKRFYVLFSVGRNYTDTVLAQPPSSHVWPIS